MRTIALVLAAVISLAMPACGGATEPSANGEARGSRSQRLQRGRASFYGNKFHGRKTASGERFSQRKLTAAHRKLPFGTMVRVTNLANGKSVVVRINDRGPFGRRGGIIDLSRAAAEKIDMIRDGRAAVTVEILQLPDR